MSMRYLIVILSVLWPLLAQPPALDSTPTGWPIVERCLPHPQTPPEDWQLDGQILMRGWAGIHAVSAEFDTPYIISWGNAIPSPDGKWLLTQEHSLYTEQLTGGGPMGLYHHDYGDIVVKSFLTGEVRRFEWQAYVGITSRPYPFPPAGPLWLNNEEFLAFYGYGGREFRVGNIETGNITEWSGIESDDPAFSISPDVSRAVSYDQLYDLSDNSLISEINGVMYGQRAVWMSDSSTFAHIITDHYDDGREYGWLVIVDRDGQILESPFPAIRNTTDLGEWSPDNRYLSFNVLTYSDQKYDRSSYLLDSREQLIYSLCQDLSGWAWSPDGKFFATVLGSEGQRPVIVMDIESWQPYTVAYHTGSVLFWRSIE